MKKTILLAVMVSVSIIATAQTFESPILYKNIDESNPHEWVMLETDTNLMLIYGDKGFIDDVSSEWFVENGLDITKPDEVKSTRKHDIDVWYTVNKFNEPLKVAIYEDKTTKTFIIGILE